MRHNKQNTGCSARQLGNVDHLALNSSLPGLWSSRGGLGEEPGPLFSFSCCCTPWTLPSGRHSEGSCCIASVWLAGVEVWHFPVPVWELSFFFFSWWLLFLIYVLFLAACRRKYGPILSQHESKPQHSAPLPKPEARRLL